MKENKTSDAQIRASRNWEERNREKTTIDTYKRTARMYVRKYANDDDIEELLEAYKKENKKD